MSVLPAWSFSSRGSSTTPRGRGWRGRTIQRVGPRAPEPGRVRNSVRSGAVLMTRRGRPHGHTTNRRIQTFTTALLVALLAGCRRYRRTDRSQNAGGPPVSFGSVHGEIGLTRGIQADRGGSPATCPLRPVVARSEACQFLHPQILAIFHRNPGSRVRTQPRC